MAEAGRSPTLAEILTQTKDVIRDARKYVPDLPGIDDAPIGQSFTLEQTADVQGACARCGAAVRGEIDLLLRLQAEREDVRVQMQALQHRLKKCEEAIARLQRRWQEPGHCSSPQDNADLAVLQDRHRKAEEVLAARLPELKKRGQSLDEEYAGHVRRIREGVDAVRAALSSLARAERESRRTSAPPPVMPSQPLPVQQQSGKHTPKIPKRIVDGVAEHFIWAKGQEDLQQLPYDASILEELHVAYAVPFMRKEGLYAVMATAFVRWQACLELQRFVAENVGLSRKTLAQLLRHKIAAIGVHLQEHRPPSLEDGMITHERMVMYSDFFIRLQGGGKSLHTLLQEDKQQFRFQTNRGIIDVASLFSEFTYDDFILNITARRGELFPESALQIMLQECEEIMSSAIGKAARLASFLAGKENPQSNKHPQFPENAIRDAAVRFCAVQCRFPESQAQASKIKEQTALQPGYLHDCIRQIRAMVQQPQSPLTRRVHFAFGLSILLRHALDRDRHEHIAVQEFAGAQVQRRVRQALEQQHDPAKVIRWIGQLIQGLQDFLRQPRSPDIQTDASVKIRVLTHAKMHLSAGGEHAWNEAYEQEFARLSPEERYDYEGIVDQLSGSVWGEETVELDPYLVRAKQYLSQDALNALRSESLAVRSLLHPHAMAFVTLTERKNGISISDAAGAAAIARRLMPLLVDPLEPECRAQRTWQQLKDTRYADERERAERLAAYMLIIVERMRDVRAPLTARAFAADEVAAYCTALESELGFGLPSVP